MSDSQKFVSRNRAPRVQIEYDVELYGASKKIELPFVQGVMSDLSGRTKLPPVKDRKFLEIDAENFDERMEGIAPTAKFSVPNTLTGEGQLSVDLAFRKMDDFSPEAIARNVDALRPLLEAREQLQNLLAYMDGKSGAEALIEKLLQDTSVLTALAGQGGNIDDHGAVLDDLRKSAPADNAPEDTSDATLDALRAVAPTEEEGDDGVGDVLAELAEAAPEIEDDQDTSDDVLSALEAPEQAVPDDTSSETLDALRAAAPTEEEGDDGVGDVLAELAEAAPEIEDQHDTTDDVLSGLEAPEQSEPDDTPSETLDALRAAAPTEQHIEDGKAAVLEALASDAPQENTDDTGTDDILASLEAPEASVAEDTASETLDALKDNAPAVESDPDQHAAALRSLSEVDVQESTDDTSADDILASIEAPLEDVDVNTSDSTLDDLKERTPLDEEQVDTQGEVLSSLANAKPADEGEDTSADAILGALDTPPEVEPTDDGDAALEGLREQAPEPVREPEASEEALKSLADVVVDAPQESDDSEAVLAGLNQIADAPEPVDETAKALKDLRSDEVDETAREDDGGADVLASLADAAPDDVSEGDDREDVLAGLSETAPADVQPDDDLDEILAGLDTPAQDDTAEDRGSDVLASLAAEAVDESDTTDVTDNVLASIEIQEPVEQEDSSSETLDALRSEQPFEAEKETDRGEDVLSQLASEMLGDDAEEETENLRATLEELSAAPVEADDKPDMAEKVLAGLETPSVELEEDDVSAALDGLLDSAGIEEAPQDSSAEVLSELVKDDPETPETDKSDGLVLETPADIQQDGVDKGPDEADTTSAGPEGAESGGSDRAGSNFAPGDDPIEGASTDQGVAQGSSPSNEDVDADDDFEGVDIDVDELLAELDDDDDDDDDEDAALEDLLAALEADDEDDAEIDDTPPSLETSSASDSEPETIDLDALLEGLVEGIADADSDDEADDELTSMSPVDLVDDDDDDDDLDALLAELDAGDDADVSQDTNQDEPELDLDAELDALLAELDDDMSEPETAETSQEHDDQEPDAPTMADEPEGPSDGNEPQEGDVFAPATHAPFGRMAAPQIGREDMNRSTFRMAIFGDFTGRSTRGILEIGDALSNRRAISLDVDTIDEVIEGFATTLHLPIGKGGANVAVKLGELDDLEPDELFDNVEIFDALSGLKQRLGVGSMADKAREQLQAWGETYSRPVKLPKRSASTSIPADRKLSDFQALIGDTERRSAPEPTPAEDLIAQIIGPHIVRSPGQDVAAMQDAVDDALSTAMRLVLHHPDFQAIESQWRSLDMLARRIETDSNLEIVLFDVSAEELAADLAVGEDLTDCGLYKLLSGVIDPETRDGGFSALFGLYTFEETPPHAELLGRLGRIAAQVDAPFFSAITPSFIEIDKKDRNPLVAKAWDELRQMPEAQYLGVASPRFMLRRPYGTKSEPISAFKFEEFTPQEGLSGLLWANPVVLVAILLGAAYSRDGKSMSLGGTMSLGEIPFHYVEDKFGDQVALPCTERNLTTSTMERVITRGFMPVLSIKGRDEIRLGSFQSLAGTEIAGPWSDNPPPERSSPSGGGLSVSVEHTMGQPDDEDQISVGDADDMEEILAGFGEDDDDNNDTDVDDDEMDPELAALLEGL